jgi:phosphopantothenoylcysteine synthetase/decarboxylase
LNPNAKERALKILVTTGNTQTPIDDVRCITNIFTGRTGTRIALEANRRGHNITLLASHPNVVQELQSDITPRAGTWNCLPYRTFDELHNLMSKELREEQYDVVIHSAAVSDYALAGTYAVASASQYDTNAKGWPRAAAFMEVTGGKIKSSYGELWLRLVPTIKLADQVRAPWGFDGMFVKFKLEVGVSHEQLQEIAERSRDQSDADLIVANTLEGKNSFALIGDRQGEFIQVQREELASKLINKLESM